jgi:hypothetical protein
MAPNKKMHRNILIRSLAVIVLFGIYAFSMLVAVAEVGVTAAVVVVTALAAAVTALAAAVSTVVAFAAVVSAAADSVLVFIPATTMAITPITKTRVGAIWFASVS